MPKTIDVDKLYDWLYGNGYHEICEEIRLREGAGSFSPTPPVQPDTPEPGNKVRHQDHEQWGIGKVLTISKSKKSAECRFEYTTTGSLGISIKVVEQAYYRLDKLEVITDDPST